MKFGLLNVRKNHLVPFSLQILFYSKLLSHVLLTFSDKLLTIILCPFSELLVITVATNETDGFKRYMRSAKLHNINGKVIYFRIFFVAFFRIIALSDVF